MEGVSVLFDIIYMWRHEQNGFIKLLTIILTLGKIPTFFILLQTLKARGDQYAHSISGGGGFQSQTGMILRSDVFKLVLMALASLVNARRIPTGGYDPVGDDLEGAAPQPPPPRNVQPTNPSHHHQPISQGQAPQTAVPGGYQAS
ncbi:hypothetical protein RHS01_00968 [Rhizoctonia solani]|uniref:Uncharacterized protein n=1 Tax=Rhizoctonia solani TaxID=456999 RepID=A0A8H7IMJ7_9AGAM|nr:hypothetical protein RHS01_00968 [Rhizoctonia solani]